MKIILLRKFHLLFFILILLFLLLSCPPHTEAGTGGVTTTSGSKCINHGTQNVCRGSDPAHSFPNVQAYCSCDPQPPAGYWAINSSDCKTGEQCFYPQIGCGGAGQINGAAGICEYPTPGPDCGQYARTIYTFKAADNTSCGQHAGDFNGACCDVLHSAPQPTPTPLPTDDCTLKNFGYCTDASDYLCAAAPNIYSSAAKLSPIGDLGCTKARGAPSICCAPACASKGGGCQDDLGITARCCDKGSQCTGTQNPKLSVCSSCIAKAGPGQGTCNSDTDCCYDNKLRCDTTGKISAKGQCYTCIDRGNTGCIMSGPSGQTNNSNCCTSGDECTNDGKCQNTSAGIQCPGGDVSKCLPGQTCINNQCVGTNNPPAGNITNPCPGNVCNTAIGNINVNTGQDFVTRIFQVILGLSGGIAVLLIIYSGYSMVLSQGNPEKIQGAKETLTSAIIGLVFIILSLTILTIIGVDVLGLPGFKR